MELAVLAPSPDELGEDDEDDVDDEVVDEDEVDEVDESVELDDSLEPPSVEGAELVELFEPRLSVL